MSQEETGNIFKENKDKIFKAEQVRQELKERGIDINIQSCYNNLRRLAKRGLINRSDKVYYYKKEETVTIHTIKIKQHHKNVQRFTERQHSKVTESDSKLDKLKRHGVKIIEMLEDEIICVKKIQNSIESWILDSRGFEKELEEFRVQILQKNQELKCL